MRPQLAAWALIPLLFSASPVRAADLPGTWQGTLTAGQALRLVFAIVSSDGGTLTATVHSIDQGGQAFPAAVTADDSTVRVAVSSIGATFEGRINSSGTAIAGTWTQANMPFPLTLTRATPDTAWAIPTPPVRVGPMASTAPLTLEVATIKPSRPGTPGKLITVKGRQVLTVNTSLADLISFAYDVHASQLDGGPSWATSTHFDITAQPDAQGLPNIAQLKGLIRTLLRDRFRLASHAETRDLPIYAIVAGSGAHKLTGSTGDPDGLPSLLFQRLGVLPARNASMADLASVLQSAVLDRPVIDRTTLQGRWDFTLTWTPDDSQFQSLGVRVPPPPGDGSGPPGLFTAMQEQLGLRLDATKGSATVLVIDQVEQPSDN